MSDLQETFREWCVVELLGHRRLGALVSEQEIAGKALLRLEIPGPDGAFVATQYVNPDSLYCLTPTTEEMARAVALSNQPQPATRWELKALEPPRRLGANGEDLDDPDVPYPDYEESDDDEGRF